MTLSLAVHVTDVVAGTLFPYLLFSNLLIRNLERHHVSTPTLTAGVLADRIPTSRVRDALLVLGGTLFVAIASQIVIPLGFTPVPLSLSTFAVILTGACLGTARATMSLGLYMVLGVAGAPIFAEQSSGWESASFGYIIGYILAGAAAGYLAERGFDRSVGRMALLVLTSSVLIYAVGLPWLMAFTGASFTAGVEMGIVPFLVGDAIKGVAAMALLPATWHLIGKK